MKDLRVKIKGGYIKTIVCDSDFDWAYTYKWYLLGKNYVARQVYSHFKNGRSYYKKIYLHREIMKALPKQEVDHINRNTLDNRKENLRFCTKHQNQGNRKVTSNSSSRYKGVRLEPPSHRKFRTKLWRAELRKNNKTIYLGNFINEKEAALAYNEAAKSYFGEFAHLNNV